MLGGSESFLSMAFESGFVVGGVLIVLFLCSVGCWAVIIYKHSVLRKVTRESREFMDIFLGAHSFSAAMVQIEHLAQSPLAQIFKAGYSEWLKGRSADEEKEAETDEEVEPVSMADLHLSPGSVESVGRSLARAKQTETARLQSLLIFLATVASAAPFIGLFGTVWGIMESFRSIGVTGTANLAVVAPGISEALIATATGLAAAIPAVVAYNYFNNTIRVLATEMEAFSSEFLNVVSRSIGEEDK